MMFKHSESQRSTARAPKEQDRWICQDHRKRVGHRRVPEGRTLHVIDIENLLGDPLAAESDVVRVLQKYMKASNWRIGDHTILAGHPDLLMKARRVEGLTFRALAAYGPDGADNALLNAVNVAFASSRYCRVSIGSGDHAFADLAAGLGAEGQLVWVVCRRGSLARILRLAAAHVRHLTEDRPSPMEGVLVA